MPQINRITLKVFIQTTREIKLKSYNCISIQAFNPHGSKNGFIFIKFNINPRYRRGNGCYRTFRYLFVSAVSTR